MFLFLGGRGTQTCCLASFHESCLSGGCCCVRQKLPRLAIPFLSPGAGQAQTGPVVLVLSASVLHNEDLALELVKLRTPVSCI